MELRRKSVAVRSVAALFARKSTSPGCWPRRDKKCPLVCHKSQPDRRASVLFLSTALVSIGPIESYDSTSYVKWGEGDEAGLADESRRNQENN